MSIVQDFIGGDFFCDTIKKCLCLRGEEQQQLMEYARKVRLDYFPSNQVEVRSVIEISNICKQKCRYCSIGGKEQALDYILDPSTIVSLVSYLYQCGRRVVMLQSGENKDIIFINNISCTIKEIKERFPDIEIILCLGNMSHNEYRKLSESGADRYILKFETSNADLFSRCKPNDTLKNRLNCMQAVIDSGMKLGSGNIIGLPGQTIDDIVNDILLINKLRLDMNSTSTFIPAEKSEFKGYPMGNVDDTLNMMAMMRIMNPSRLMPTTSSLEKAGENGQLRGLLAGANTITIHDGTPRELIAHFPIYSDRRVRPQREYFKKIVADSGMNVDNI